MVHMGDLFWHIWCIYARPHSLRKCRLRFFMKVSHWKIFCPEMLSLSFFMPISMLYSNFFLHFQDYAGSTKPLGLTERCWEMIMMIFLGLDCTTKPLRLTKRCWEMIMMMFLSVNCNWVNYDSKIAKYQNLHFPQD